MITAILCIIFMSGTYSGWASVEPWTVYNILEKFKTRVHLGVFRPDTKDTQRIFGKNWYQLGGSLQYIDDKKGVSPTANIDFLYKSKDGKSSADDENSSGNNTVIIIRPSIGAMALFGKDNAKLKLEGLLGPAIFWYKFKDASDTLFDDYSLGWHVSAGVGLNIYKNFDIDLKYHFSSKVGSTDMNGLGFYFSCRIIDFEEWF